MSPSTSVIQDWNRIASSYGQGAGTSEDRVYQQIKAVLWESLGDVRGLDVLDLGCGTGWFSQQLVDAGAHVLGVDGSVELLNMARSHYPELEVIEHDLMQGLPPLARSFDRIVALMVLMDIPELDVLVTSVRSVLKPKGTFIFTMPHPCFFNMKPDRDEETGVWFRKVTGYHESEVWRIESFGGHNHYHRSLTYYFELFRANGLAVTRLYEPEHIVGAEGEDDRRAFLKSIPVFILIEATVL